MEEPQTQRWLSIVVDVNAVMEPHWPRIFSQFLLNLIRSFFHNSHQEGELALIIFNANSGVGRVAQLIKWTRNVDGFLEILSSLPFNNQDISQCAIAEGLAEALVMYPKPSSNMTIKEYYNGERHCILVTASNPIPKTLLLFLPKMNQEAQFVSNDQLEPRRVDLLDVAQMFCPLGISLSVITPRQHPTYGAMFNLGNNVYPVENTLIPDNRIGEYTVLMSRNFKEAHYVLHQQRTVSLPHLMTTSDDVTFATFFSVDHQENQSSASNVTVEEQTGEADENVRLESEISQSLESQPVVPNANSDQTEPEQPMSVFDEILAELDSDFGIDALLPKKKPKTMSTSLSEDDNLEDLFQPDQHFFDEIQGLLEQDPDPTMIPKENLQTAEHEYKQVIEDPSPKNTTFSFTSMSFANSSEGSSLHGKFQNYPVLTSETYSKSSFLSLQKSSNLRAEGSQTWYNQKGKSSTTFGQGIVDPWEASSCGTSTLVSPNTTRGKTILDQLQKTGNSIFDQFQPRGNSIYNQFQTKGKSIYDQFQPRGKSIFDQFQPMGNPIFDQFQTRGKSIYDQFPSRGNDQLQTRVNSIYDQFQTSSSSMLNPYAGGQGGTFLEHNHHMMNGNGPLDHQTLTSSTWDPQVPINNDGQPIVVDFKDYVHTWEGSLFGKIQPRRLSFCSRAKAFRRASSSLVLTLQWRCRLEISNFVPQTALQHTLNIAPGPFDYVLFEITQLNDLSLYNHLKSKKLCVKVDLPWQTLIILPTKSVYLYFGVVFRGDTVFVEPYVTLPVRNQRSQKKCKF